MSSDRYTTNLSWIALSFCLIIQIIITNPVQAQDRLYELSANDMVEFTLDGYALAQIDGKNLVIMPEAFFPDDWELILNIQEMGHFVFEGHNIYDG